MEWMLALLVTLFLATRSHCQPKLTTQTVERPTMDTRRQLHTVPMVDLKHHTLLDLAGLGREEVNSALKVLSSIFNFVDIYGRPRYPVMDSYYSWFKWVDRNLPLVLGTYMAPTDLDPEDETKWEPEDFEYYLFLPYKEKRTSTRNVIWSNFYKKIYTDMIAQNVKSPRTEGNRRHGSGFCLEDMYPGYSSIEVDVMGQMFKYAADNTFKPVYEFVMGRDPYHATMMRVDPLHTLSEHLAYFMGLSDDEDSYSFYESRIDAEDRSASCVDSTARVMQAVMPYGPFLTLSNLVAVGVWMMAFWAPFLGF